MSKINRVPENRIRYFQIPHFASSVTVLFEEMVRPSGRPHIVLAHDLEDVPGEKPKVFRAVNEVLNVGLVFPLFFCSP